MVIPVYNAQSCIDQALHSVAIQTYPVHEVIVVDDGSSDGTAEKVHVWQGRLPIVLIKNETNIGICGSLRKGILATTGEWILRLDADDRWLRDHVRSIRNVINDASIVIAASAALIVKVDGSQIGTSRFISDSKIRAHLMWDNPVVHSAVGFSRIAYDAVGGYRNEMRWEDYDLWIRLLTVGRMGATLEPTVEYTVSQTSLSRVKKSISLGSRWTCQKLAIKKFWKRHPIVAISTLTAGSIRLVVSRLLSK